MCQCGAADRRFSPGTLVSITNKTDRHCITEILLKVAVSTITQFLTPQIDRMSFYLNTIVVDTSHPFPYSRLITMFVTRLLRRVLLVVFGGVSVTRTLVICVCFVDLCLSFLFWPLYCLSFFDIRF